MKETRYNRHHILYNRQAWTNTPDLTALREDPRLITNIPVDIHQELHRQVSHVPPLSYHMARRVLRSIRDKNDEHSAVGNVLHLQESIEQACRHPKADIIEREVGSTAIRALELQKPFLDDQLPSIFADISRLREQDLQTIAKLGI